ncbi:polyprenol phosphomannose-dependent alpha 1,6 mannosyltransferase MptB [Streptomyces sp. NPDC053541]|uniref:polyprenol phosphomannose-dependent alpha 1,6 mannosyltransferase MptB n=1 Tax=Streptomyces sp. NPDC053541 TaxID=3365709 RepID=UPI0037CD4C75
MWVFSTAGCRWLGAAGALAVTLGGWAAGALPVRGGAGLWERHGGAVTTAGTLLGYLGLTLLVLAWWQYGRGLRAGARDRVGVTLACWAAPLLVAPPLHSADVYSYLAQGAMVLEGHDVYGAGPSVLRPGELGFDAAASVGGHWTDTPAPYGPFFLVLAQAVVKLTGGAVLPGVLGMRLIALLALLLIVRAVRGLASERHREGAVWLAALNPLLLLHVLGGLHNDGLMAGLLLAGLLCAVRARRWAVGGVLAGALIGLAATIKSPAALGLLFAGIVLARRRGPAAGLLPGAVAVGVAAGASVLAGTGFGWLRTQSVAGTIHTALSLTSDLGLGLGLLVSGEPEPVKGAVQKLGLLAAGAVVAAVAWRAWKGRLDPVLGLGVSLLALVALSPMVQPWYVLWGTCAVAAVAWNGRLGQLLAVVCAGLAYETAPSGHTPWYGFLAGGAVVAAGLWWSRREPWRADAPEHGTGDPVVLPAQTAGDRDRDRSARLAGRGPGAD